MDRNISEWSAAEVQTELQRLGLGQPTTDIFTDIDGAMIQFVSKSELRSLGVPIKDRLKIQEMISKEKENQGAQNTKYLHKLSIFFFRKVNFSALLSGTERRRILEDRRRISEEEDASGLNAPLFLKFCFLPSEDMSKFVKLSCSLQILRT